MLAARSKRNQVKSVYYNALTLFLAPLGCFLANCSSSVPSARFLDMSYVFRFFFDVFSQISRCLAIRSSAKPRPQIGHWLRSSRGFDANRERRADVEGAAVALLDDDDVC